MTQHTCDPFDAIRIEWKRVRVKYQHLIRINVNEIFRLIRWRLPNVLGHLGTLGNVLSDCDWQLRYAPNLMTFDALQLYNFWLCNHSLFFIFFVLMSFFKAQNLIDNDKKHSNLKLLKFSGTHIFSHENHKFWAIVLFKCHFSFDTSWQAQHIV